jgi:hypothetical protein
VSKLLPTTTNQPEAFIYSAGIKQAQQTNWQSDIHILSS